MPRDAGPLRDAGAVAVDAGGALDAGASDGAIVMDATSGDAASGDASIRDATTAADAVTPDATSDASATPLAPSLPAKTGTCPQFVSGDVNFAPAGVAQRKVRLWVGANGGGPLVIYWHSTGNQPIEAENSALAGVLAQITAAGGVVAAPYTGANDGTFPWLNTTTESLKVADEIVACAIEVKSIDSRRIHAIGFSAGGLMTSTMSFLRSNYLASVVPYSGGLQGSAPAFQNASNKLAALIFHGGSSDVFLVNFQTASNSYRTALRNNGSYTATCNHGGGHAIPSAGAAAAWRFFQDHPFNTQPSPYVAGGLPTALPSYCSTP